MLVEDPASVHPVILTLQSVEFRAEVRKALWLVETVQLVIYAQRIQHSTAQQDTLELRQIVQVLYVPVPHKVQEVFTLLQREL